MGEDNEEETSGMERTAFWITKDSNGWSFIWLQLTWSFNILSFHPAVENLLLLLCCQPAWILKRKVLKDGHRLIVRAELIGWSQLHVYIAFAKHTCLVFRTQWSVGELIWSSMLILPSCILGRVRAKWSQGRETSDPIRTSQKTTAMIELNFYILRKYMKIINLVQAKGQWHSGPMLQKKGSYQQHKFRRLL